MGELIIKISEGSPNANITFTDDKGLVKQKSTEIESLISGLVSDYTLTTGLLPLGTRLYKGSNANFGIVIETPAKVRDMTLSKYNSTGSKRINEVIQVPYPVCLFYFNIKDGKMWDTRIHSLKYPIQSENDQLYCFPYSNVYRDGRVCWGEVTIPKIVKPMDLVGVINLFLGSQFNGDLAGGNFTPPKDKNFNDFWSLVNYVKPMQEFPIEVLAASGLTLKQILREKE